MTEEQKKEELVLDKKPEEEVPKTEEKVEGQEQKADQPVEEPGQEQGQGKGQEQEQGQEQTQEQKEAEKDSQEVVDKIKNEMLNSATKDEDLFLGPYERLIDRKFIPDPNYKDTKILPTENFNSEIIPKRQFYYKILITRPKREFEAPINNLFQDKNSSEEQTVGNNEVKGVKSANEYPLSERSSIEMGFQTANSTVPKSFQVAKK